MSQPLNFVFFCSDPGAANSLIVLAKHLTPNYKIQMFARSAAFNHIKTNSNLSVTLVPDTVDQYSLSQFKTILRQYMPAVVVTGTTGRDYTERTIWQACQALTIPCCAVLDQWMNYALRFLKKHLAYQDKLSYTQEELCLPDSIIVMDDFAKHDMANEGIPSNIIEVCGSPYYEYMGTLCKNARLGKNSTKTVLFACEPITAVYGNRLGKKIHGYTEKTILNALCEEIQRQDRNKKISLQIRPHPRERKNRYTAFIARYGFANMNSAPSVIDALKGSDMVIGMSSTLLLEAAILGKPIASIQIGASLPSLFYLEQIGRTQSIRHRYQLRRLVQHLLLGHMKPFQIEMLTKNGACHNIERHLLSLLK
ncbi:DUF354 domain-containing protein [Pseudoalteromonas viridis]|uniref:DUF354 domain-containing protein n=1 Tax=Pseudoalteromonas viridis TaxID=339617 RepID=A0ABX7V0C2_9GAMM|nr:DUF354 domain-containing protein [Pseudoalteromonas viridis]QTL34224.1 DUF354 domain-containing protein [Pseudoalteromonas viridis]